MNVKEAIDAPKNEMLLTAIRDDWRVGGKNAMGYPQEVSNTAWAKVLNPSEELVEKARAGFEITFADLNTEYVECENWSFWAEFLSDRKISVELSHYDPNTEPVSMGDHLENLAAKAVFESGITSELGLRLEWEV